MSSFINLFTKQLFIIIFIFLILLWLQCTDDKKYNIKRKTLYDKIKIPIFMACLFSLILISFNHIDCLDYVNNYLFNNKQIYNQDVYIEPFL